MSVSGYLVRGASRCGWCSAQTGEELIYSGPIVPVEHHARQLVAVRHATIFNREFLILRKLDRQRQVWRRNRYSDRVIGRKMTPKEQGIVNLEKWRTHLKYNSQGHLE